MFNWIKNKRKSRNKEIANEVVSQLSSSSGWEKFLPPVQLRDAVYMVTENGSVYKMRYDECSQMEMIIQIRRG